MLNYTKIREYLKKHRQNSILHKILTGAAAVVVFVTTYALILPAITLETKPACGIEEHTHNELDCYLNGGEFTCQIIEHTHTDECYPAEDIIATISSNESITESPESETPSDTVSSNEPSDDTSTEVVDNVTGEDISSNDQTGAEDTISGGDVSAGDASWDSSEEKSLTEKRYTDGKVVITAYYEETAEIPEEAMLVAYQVTAENAPGHYEQRQEEAKAAIEELLGGGADTGNASSTSENADATVSGNETDSTQDEYLIYNIGFYVDGKEIEPKDKVKLTVQFLSEEGFAVGDPITIIHFTEEGTAETIKGSDVEVDEDGELSTTFETDSFSEFVFTNAAFEESGVTVYGLVDGVWYINEAEEEDAAQSFADALNDTSFNGTIMIQRDFTLNTLTSDIGVPELNNGRNVTIDLNGHKVGADGVLVQVNSGATLVVKDSASPSVTREIVPTDEDASTDTPSILDYDKTAIYDSTNIILTYYVTETEIIDTATGATKETLVKYTVNAQNMGILTGYGISTSVINVNGGTLTFESGMVANSLQRAMHVVNGGTANLNGGYLCGNNIYSGNDTAVDGGAVYAHQSTINISGTVVAGNRARFGGGIHVTETSTVNISENAMIAGNVVTGRGGGVDTWNSSINMSGGYVTNNIANDATEYYSGGGGILMRGGNSPSEDKIVLSGGYITGNKAYGGGGLYLGPGANVGLVMTGGFVTANYSSIGEGGGIRIDHSCIGRITGGYITNNITASQQHWGGGGLFIADGATCQLMSVLVTNNDAGGFGGGVAGCSTGRIHVSAIENETKGAAIYANRAEGENISGTDSIKQEDHTYAKSNSVFMESGYQDYFCMLYSNVTGSMLGDGYENWVGSIDGVAVTIPGDESKVGNSVVGLTADPTTEHIVAAQDMAAAQNGVYINGNSAYTHGGGILCNGYMVMGALSEETIPEFVFGTRMELAGVKDYLSAADNSPIAMEGKEFTFILKNAETEQEVAKAYNDATGALVFDRRLVFGENLNPQPGIGEENAVTYRYILSEVDSGVGIITDQTEYLVEIDVYIKKEYGYISTLNENGEVVEEAIIKSIYHLQEVRVYKGDSATGSWGETIMTISETEMESKEENQAIIVDLRNSDTYTTFVNYAMDETALTVNKEWGETTPEEEKKEVEVILYQDGVQYGDPVILNAPNWSYTWPNLEVMYTETDSETGETVTRLHTYSVKETTFEGYLAEYTYTSQAESAAFWVPASTLEAGNQYLIVNEEENIILNVTASNWNSDFDSGDQLNISSEITDGSIIGEQYANVTCYAAENIPDTAIFLAQKYKERVVLKNTGYYDSWIQVYSANYWGGSTERLVSYASFFEYNNGLLQGRQGNAIDGTLRTIQYGYFDGAYQFTVSDTATDTVNAQLYTLERTISDGATTVTITNTPIEEADFDLNITKDAGYMDENGDLQITTNANGDGVLLAGAQFQIFRSNNLKEPLEFTQLVNGNYQFYEESEAQGNVQLTSTLTSGTGGTIKVVGMRTGEYVLKEITAPVGYTISKESEAITFRLYEETENGIESFEVINEAAEYILPETGGSGTSMYTMAGLLLTCSAVYLMYRNEKRRKEGKTSS